MSTRARSLVRLLAVNNDYYYYNKQRATRKACEVFINHRGIDTKSTIATLLYDHLSGLKVRSFLDNKTMKPGDKLFDKIDNAIGDCKLGVAVFSPRYCESYFCLHELALFVESKKKFIPIYCDVDPSQLCIIRDGKLSDEEIQRFDRALDEAKNVVGLTFDSSKGNLSDVVRSASKIIIRSLIEIEKEKRLQNKSQFAIK